MTQVLGGQFSDVTRSMNTTTTPMRIALYPGVKNEKHCTYQVFGKLGIYWYILVHTNTYIHIGDNHTKT
jgi:hypothetical protein